MFAPAEPYPLDYFVNALTGSGRRIRTENLEIPPPAEVIVKGRGFENGANFLQRVPAARSDVVSANRHLSLRGPHLAEHHADGGALARAIVPEQTVNFAHGDSQAKVIHRQTAAELFRNIFESDHGCC